LKRLDPGFPRNGWKIYFQTFYGYHSFLEIIYEIQPFISRREPILAKIYYV